MSYMLMLHHASVIAFFCVPTSKLPSKNVLWDEENEGALRSNITIYFGYENVNCVCVFCWFLWRIFAMDSLGAIVFHCMFYKLFALY
jgi:hypothetical protein